MKGPGAKKSSVAREARLALGFVFQPVSPAIPFGVDAYALRRGMVTKECAEDQLEQP